MVLNKVYFVKIMNIKCILIIVFVIWFNLYWIGKVVNMLFGGKLGIVKVVF